MSQTTTMKPKAKTITLTGIVEKCELKLRSPFTPNYYSPNEQHEVYLDVTLRLENGDKAYFKTAAARRSIANAPGVAIVMYWIEGEAENWLRRIEGSGVATPGQSNTNGIEPAIRVGQTITISGRVKSETVSRKGLPYRVLNWVRLQPTV